MMPLAVSTAERTPWRKFGGGVMGASGDAETTLILVESGSSLFSGLGSEGTSAKSQTTHRVVSGSFVKSQFSQVLCSILGTENVESAHGSAKKKCKKVGEK